MAPLPYAGPTALAGSKYAPFSTRRAPPAVPPAVSSTQGTPTKSTIATKEQIAASHDESSLDIAHNAGADLAIAQGNTLKEAVDKHAANFSRTVSATVTNTRKLLELIREALKEDDAAALKTVDDLWTELELLLEAAKGAKDALPEFLEKQRDNMALYHGAMMNEAYQETQQELNLQHKKVNLQHSVILEQQQSYQDFKAQMATRLKELEDLRERSSRLVLEKGNLKDEIDKYVKMLDKEQNTKAADLEKINGLQKELEALIGIKTELLVEVDRLQKVISDMQDKSQAAERKIADDFVEQLKIKADQLAKETAKSVQLATLLNQLKSQEANDKTANGKTANDKLKADNKMIKEKYDAMSSEHAQAFKVSRDGMHASTASG